MLNKILEIEDKVNWGDVLNGFLSNFIFWIITGLILLFLNNKIRKQLFLYLKRLKLKLFPVKFNVGLSINTNDGINAAKYFSEIRKNLERAIENLGLEKIIVIKDFSGIYAFKNKKEAENYVNNNDLDLIIWGDFSPDGLKLNNEIISKIKLNFTYSYPKDIQDKDNKLGNAISLDISSRLAIKNYWQIMENNSLNDIEIVSNNLADISLYIIGITLKFYGRLRESKQILEKLYNKLIQEVDNFKDLVWPHLLECYIILAQDVITTKKSLHNGIEYCKEILKVEPLNYFALTNIAAFYYKVGDNQKCEKIVDELLSAYPKDSCTEVDVAFIRIIQKKYKNAYKHYIRLVNLNFITFDFQEVVEFLSNEYDKTKEPAMLYGAGIISYYWGDKILAKQDLTNFINLTNDRDYKEMYRNAKRLVK